MIVTEPAEIPLTWGCVTGDTEPAPINTPPVTVALEESLLVSTMVTPPAGAAVDKVTGKVAVPPAVTLVLAGKPMVPA